MNQPELIGTMLANSNDETQADVLNEFVSVLRVICKPKDFASLSMQTFWISRRLKPDTVEFLRELISDYEHQRHSLPADVQQLYEQKEQLRRDVIELERRKTELDGF